MSNRLTLKKEERLSSRKSIEQLFSGGSARSLSSFPLRVVFRPLSEVAPLTPSVRMLVSVPKRYFKHAVDRNRVKRQVREAYRKNKAILTTAIAISNYAGVNMALIWTDGSHRDSAEVEHRVKHLLTGVAERGLPPAPSEERGR